MPIGQAAVWLHARPTRAGPVMLVGVLPAAQKYPAGHTAAITPRHVTSTTTTTTITTMTTTDSNKFAAPEMLAAAVFAPQYEPAGHTAMHRSADDEHRAQSHVSTMMPPPPRRCQPDSLSALDTNTGTHTHRHTGTRQPTHQNMRPDSIGWSVHCMCPPDTLPTHTHIHDRVSQ